MTNLFVDCGTNPQKVIVVDAAPRLPLLSSQFWSSYYGQWVGRRLLVSILRLAAVLRWSAADDKVTVIFAWDFQSECPGQPEPAIGILSRFPSRFNKYCLLFEVGSVSLFILSLNFKVTVPTAPCASAGEGRRWSKNIKLWTKVLRRRSCS